MVDTHVVRLGGVFGSVVALLVGCSGSVVPLDKGAKGTQGTGATRGTGGEAGGQPGAEAGTDTETGGGGGSSGGGNSTDVDGGDGTGGMVGTGGASSVGRLPNTPGIKSSNKLDLLLMVDNSISMSDKQVVLSRTIPDLVRRIADPSSGITDLHVGVITSSIGGHGSSTLCVGNDQGTIYEQEQNDHGHLVGTRPRFVATPGALAPTPEGFIAWTANLGSAGLSAGIANMVTAAGEFGCGLESQLEAVYRFLVDPQPYQSITVQNCPGSMEPCAVPQGIDQELLAQRRAFLRPDSVVAVVNLSDENDCSIQESGQYFYAARDNIILPHGSSICATNPNDPCCYFCNSQPVAGCEDPACNQPTLRNKDQPNLRCFHQKQRFGFDFLYPTTRYVNALSSTKICTSRADLEPVPDKCHDLDSDHLPDIFDNPLFVSPDGKVRDASMVYFLGIVGVPYQDLKASQSATSLTYQTPAELRANGVWDVVLGNASPGNNAPPIPPTDALMSESLDPRGGMDGESPPVALAPTTAAPMTNPVNGHEWSNTDQDDLQYACIFPLDTTRDCAQEIQKSPVPGCDCKPGKEGDNNPLCQDSAGQYSTIQRYAKAYPGVRELQLIKDLGSNGLAASICAKNLTDDSRDDYGYRPAIDLLLRQVGRSVK